jgi:hypothetical protein
MGLLIQLMFAMIILPFKLAISLIRLLTSLVSLVASTQAKRTPRTTRRASHTASPRVRRATPKPVKRTKPTVIRFNPPPDWPAPPLGWSPPQGWQPDPSWPPAPKGWRFWINDPAPGVGEPTKHAPRRVRRRRINAWILGVTGAVITLIVILAQLGSQAKPSPSAAQDNVTSTASALPTISPVPLRYSSAAATSSPSTPPHRHHASAVPAQTAAAPARTAAVSTCGAPANPYNLNLCGRGHLVYDPPSDVCGYFDCIENFPNGTGYMVECNDHMYSMSGGRPGACSYHGGEDTAVTEG